MQSAKARCSQSHGSASQMAKVLQTRLGTQSFCDKTCVRLVQKKARSRHGLPLARAAGSPPGGPGASRLPVSFKLPVTHQLEGRWRVAARIRDCECGGQCGAGPAATGPGPGLRSGLSGAVIPERLAAGSARTRRSPQAVTVEIVISQNVLSSANRVARFQYCPHSTES